MKKLLFFLTSFSAFFAAQAAQIPSPAETAARIAKQFLSTDPLRYKPVGFGGAGEFAKKGYGDDFNVHYSVVSLWVNAIECARKSGDFALVDELVRHFDSFYAENRQAQCTFRHVDYNVFGALPAEIFLVNGDKRAYAMAMDFAERQWEKPGPRDPQPWYDVRELGERMNWWKQGYSAQTRLWIDDMYMITFLQSQAYRITGKKIYLERAAKEMVLYLSRIQLKNGLFHHSPEAPFAWARGNGWMAAAMTLLLEHLPKDAPERAEVEAGYRLMMATLLANQREGGLWGQIVDDEGSWDETSGSAMFAYAFQSGCNMNLLGPEYGKAAAKAYAALVAKLDANANIADVCEGTGPKDSREWYLGRGRVNGDPHGQAPLLWLCSAMLDKTLQQPCRTVENIVYRPDLKTENCRLKMKLPEKGNGFATLVWFHGGGLKGGRPGFLSLNDDSIAQVAVKYRFLGETDAEGCIEDAAAAIAWTVKNIAKYGGDPKKVFVAGHSAGGYLALMSVLDPKRLAKHGIDNTALAGVIPVSGQVTAHFNVREFSGDRDHRFLPKIDALSPLSLCANPMPPVFLVVGDRKLDIPCRAEENELMAASLKAIGKKRVCFREFPERNHVSVLGPAKVAMRDYITRTVSEITPPFRTADMLVKAHKLRKAGDAAAALTIENSVKKYALLDVPGFYTLYAKEVLADGTQVIGDDGKLPNLMSLPFYCDVLRNDSNYINTRRLALNDKNPWVLRNDDGDWLVDPSTGKVSPEALVMRALTSGNDAEIRRVMKQYSSSGIKNAKSEELFAELVKRLKNAGREDLIAAAAKERTQRERVALAAESVANAAAKKHPRLFGSAEDFEAIKRNAKTDARLAAAVARVISDADGYLKVAPVKPQKVGYRILGECRKAMTRMATLGMAWRLTGKRRYVERADRELDGIASFKDWNPGHFLDVAEMTMAVSFYYDWMYDAISPERRAQAERLVAEKGFGADGPDAFWTVLQNNWGQVCHAGMLSAAIAFADVHGDSARAFVAGMLKTLPDSMCAVAPDGCYPEGPMYWNYGMTFNVFAFAMCEAAFGSTLGLIDEPGIKETAVFPELMTGPSGRFFNFSDSGDVRSQMPALWWFARYLNRPDLVGGIEARLFDEACRQRGIGSEAENRTNRAFPISLLWYKKVPENLKSSIPDTWVARGPMPVAVQCSGREDPDCTYVGLKGGSPSFNHGHKDGGSFVLDMLGERWVEDPGRENYSKVEAQLGGRFWAPENDSPRWEVFRLGTQGHNVFMINSRQQDSAGEAVIESFQTGAVSRVVMDLRTLYPELEKAKRTSALDSVSRRWTVNDELVGLKADDEIAWGFNTRAEVSVLGKTVTLAQNGKKVSVEMDVNAKGVWTVAPAKGKFACESENPGLKRVVFVCKATDRAVHMTVTFTPRGGGKPALVALPPPVARVRPRLAGESKPGRWTIGCEVLDRELAIFSEYRGFLPQLGIRRIRLQGGWARCEKEKGKYDFSWIDEAVDFCRANNMEVLLETSYGNPIYEGAGGWDLGAGFPRSEEGLAAWDRWVEAMAKHFKGRVTDWAMWNEPDLRGGKGREPKTPEEIAAFNVRTARIIKRVIPDAKISALSLAHNEPAFLKKCLLAMKDELHLFYDVIYHGYSSNPDDSYERVEGLKKVLAEIAPHLKLAQGENGAPSSYCTAYALKNIHWNELSQAKWDVRRMLGDLGHDVPSSVFTIMEYAQVNRPLNTKGLIAKTAERKFRTVKPAFWAVRNTASIFSGELERIKDAALSLTGERTSAFAYKTPEGLIVTYWDASKRPDESLHSYAGTLEISGALDIKDPVLVDPLSGDVYDVPSVWVERAQGSLKVKGIPVYDYPWILASKAAIALSPPVTSAHPRLMADADDFARLRADDSELSKAGKKRVIREADLAMGYAPVTYDKIGRRLLSVSRRALARTLALSMAWKITGERRYSERAVKEAMAFCGFKDWNPSHFLDTAEMCLAAAIAYDWNYETMSDRERETVEKAILEKAIFAKNDKGEPINWWIYADNNWGQVCHAGILAGAIAIQDRHPVLAERVVARAVAFLPRSMEAYAEGGFPEGPAAYWHYATSFQAVAMATLEKAFGHDFGLGEWPGLSGQSDYIDAMTGPKGIFYNFADAGLFKPGEDGPRRAFDSCEFYLAKRFGNPEVLDRFSKKLYLEYCRNLPDFPGDAMRATNRLFPLALLWLPKENGARGKSSWPAAMRIGGVVPVAVLRGGEGENADYVGYKGGAGNDHHAHLDNGSFVYDSQGVRWAAELGNENYNKVEQTGLNLWSRSDDSERWSVFRLGSSAHTGIRIDGEQLIASGRADVKAWEKGGVAYAESDITGCYRNVGKVVRRISLSQTKSPVLAVSDRLEGLKPGAKVTWQLITGTDCKVLGDGSVKLSKGGKEKIMRASVPVEWKVESIAEPVNEWDSPNPGMSRVSFEVTAPESGVLSLSVEIR